jgi:23S rRNA (uracil1939-C5)-methyltransferase
MVVMDVYCGAGTIGLYLADGAAWVYGVESVPEAIEDARRNAQINGIKHVTFEVGKAEEVMPRWREQGIRPDVVVVDPPRKGCDPVLLDTVVDMHPKRLIYVSCNPATLARDARYLRERGFDTLEVQPVDMFPHTSHVECVAWMEPAGKIPDGNQ